MYLRSKDLLDDLEDQALDNSRITSPYQYKAVASEMRESLRLMMDIQKELNDYVNIRNFMNIILNVLKEECPEKIPIIAARLKATKGTTWFSEVAM